MRWLLLLLPLLLIGCGGGGGSSSPAPSTPAVVRTIPIAYGYFGIDGDQIAETADHVSYVLAPDWGDWTLPGYDTFRIGQIIAQLQEAKARGIKDAWVMVGFLTMTQKPGCTDICVSPRPDGIQRLLAFRAQLQALGLDDMVRALYPIDEPELHGLDNATLTALLIAIKQAWPEPLLAVVYGDTQTYPGLSAYDLIGKDKYGDGANVLNQLPPIGGGQRHIIVPGGANPWRNDPQPFLDYAKQHADVYAICAFEWFDRTDGQGIRSNGMADKYRAIGLALK